MKVYQIYTKGIRSNGHLLYRYNEPMNGIASEIIFTTYEKAKENLPPTLVNLPANEYQEYYIKEDEIE